MIAQINQSLDKWALAVYLFTLVGLVLHFIGNVLIGRFRERFILGHHKQISEEESPSPPARLMHWVHLISIIFLILTGFFIRYKILETFMEQWKRHHYCFMIIILANLIARIIYAFSGETKTYKDFAIGMKDILNTPQVILYYLFLRDHYEHVAKYASLQKLTYNMFWILLILQGFTGFAILVPEALLGWTGLTLDAGVLLMRVIHVGITWFFILATTVHVYLSFMEGYPLLKLILFNVEPETVSESS